MLSSHAGTSVLKLLAFSALLFACSPEIGDDCSTGTDCSSTGTRTCDTSMPGGYCTVVNCEPDSCPEEAACIGFVISVSTLAECTNANESRQLRTFCMRRCSSNDDCRSGYECIAMNGESNEWNASLVDEKRSSVKVCALPYEAMSAVDNDSATSEYCTAEPYTDDGYYDTVSGAGGEGGQSGTGGETSAGGQTSASTAEGGTGNVSSSTEATAGATQ